MRLVLWCFAGVAAGDPCAAPANRIVAENCLAGVGPEWWDVNGAGSDAVVGFSSRASVVGGEVVELKIRTTEGYEASLEVDIYRFGWYGGAGARLVAQLDVEEEAKRRAAGQPECERPEPELVDCGNWATVARFEVPESSVSGLYAARFSIDGEGGWREDASKTQFDPHHAMAGRDPSLPPQIGAHAYGAAGKYKRRSKLRRPRASLAFFVVRSTRTTHDLLLQTADQTWHAYNGYGGLTTYGSFEFPWRHAPNRTYMTEAEALVRAHKRSYNTPLVTRDYRAVNAPFGAEYPAIRFLERIGMDLHYCTGMDLGMDRASDVLSRSRAYLSVGHDEYWSYEQREAIERHRDEHGLHLNFWSGNEAYWAVRFEESGDEEPRTMVCYKETQSATKLDPLERAWTGTFRDARPINPIGPRPENALTGHMFVANAQRADPLVIDPAKFGKHRAWRHTAVATATAPLVVYPGLLGHEWDEDVDNGWRPPGLQRLSESTFEHIQAIQDWGAVFDTGAATHSLVLHYRGANKTLVFGAGCVQFSWGLDDLHDVNDPQRANKYSIRIQRDPRGPEPIVQQLALNVFADQGLAFPTLPTHLVHPQASDDDRPPTASLARAACHHVFRAAGAATDLDGNVAAVELAWHDPDRPPSRWHPADLDAVAPSATWSFRFGDEPWQLLHGDLPTHGAKLSLRVVDDSGNMATLLAVATLDCANAATDEL